MGRRGRPPYPDILTPREWEVLALLRDGLTNEAIADRLGVTHAAAKYHVSEILSKLGVATREEAAAWEPEAAQTGRPPREPQLRRWWAGAAGWLRPVMVGKAALITAAVAVLAGLGMLAWGVLRDAGEEPAGVVEASPTASATQLSATPSEQTTPPSELPPSRSLTFQPGESGRYFRGLYERSVEGVISLLVENSRPDIGSAFSVSNDGRWLAFAHNGTLYIHRRGGTEPPVPAASFEQVWDIALSPDGSRAVVSARLHDGDEGGFMVDLQSGFHESFQPGGHLLASPAWSPDGAWIAFYDGTCENEASYLVASDGSNLRKLADYRGDLAWSPDGRSIALTAHCAGGVWLADTAGSLSQLSPSNPSFGKAAWSPDGRLLSFAAEVSSGSNYRQEIRVVDTQSGGEWRVADGVNTTWSPDGQSLAFVREGNLYTANVDGSSESQIAFPTQPSISSPAWLDDGSIVFGFAPPFASSVYVTDIASGSELDLADGYGPIWSPDGSEIAFIGGGTGSGLGGRDDIYAMSAGGAHLRIVASYTWDDVVVGCETSPRYSWSRDGVSILYERGGSVALAPLDGSPERVVASGFGPVWSPDGQHIAYAASDGTGGCGIYTIPASGSGTATRITDGLRPLWSPDGRNIAFTAEWSHAGQLGGVIRSDGTGRWEFDESTEGQSFRPDDWSPDGRSLLVTRSFTDPVGGVSGMPDILIFDIATHESRFLAKGHDPKWSSDGSRIVYNMIQTTQSPYTELAEIYLINSDGSGEPRLIAEGRDPQWSRDGRSIAFTR